MSNPQPTELPNNPPREASASPPPARRSARHRWARAHPQDLAERFILPPRIREPAPYFPMPDDSVLNSRRSRRRGGAIRSGTRSVEVRRRRCSACRVPVNLAFSARPRRNSPRLAKYARPSPTTLLMPSPGPLLHTSPCYQFRAAARPSVRDRPQVPHPHDRVHRPGSPPPSWHSAVPRSSPRATGPPLRLRLSSARSGHRVFELPVPDQGSPLRTRRHRPAPPLHQTPRRVAHVSGRRHRRRRGRRRSQPTTRPH